MILLTGSNGYLGNVVQPKIRGEYSQVLGIDLGIFSFTGGWGYRKLDLSTAPYSNIFDNNFETVIHLAGISNDPSSEISQALTHKMNVEASKRLIDFASNSGVRRFIFASSASVYGCNDELVTEESTLNPQSAYAESKVEVEKYLMGFSNLNPVVLRFGTLFGVSPKMRFDLAVNLMTKTAVTDGVVKVFGSGENFRPFLDVRDAAMIIAAFTKSNISGIYNVAVCNTRILSLAEMIASMTDSKLEVESQDHADTRNYKMDCTKLKKTELFFPTTHIQYGISSVLQWCRNNRDKLDNEDFYTLRCWKNYLKGESQ